MGEKGGEDHGGKGLKGGKGGVAGGRGTAGGFFGIVAEVIA